MAKQILKDNTFGIEIEMQGITRRKAAEAIRNYFGGSACIRHSSAYSKFRVEDNAGRVWSVVPDSSIWVERGEAVELVSPILRYEDIETLQEVVRVLFKAGARVNASCGIHIHVGAAVFAPGQIRNLVNLMRAKESMLYSALSVPTDRKDRFAKPVRETVLEGVRHLSSRAELERIWYGYNGNHSHYDHSRYHGLNLHAIWDKGTIEFRYFNSSLHAGVVKSYIQLVFAICSQARTQRSVKSDVTRSVNVKYTFRCWLLAMGLIGDEFKTCRLHLLKNLQGDAAFLHGRAA